MLNERELRPCALGFRASGLEFQVLGFGTGLGVGLWASSLRLRVEEFLGFRV